MNQIKVSIIIPVYNAMPLLKRTLSSVFSQITNFSFEIIIVDDGSSDGSVDYIKAHLNEKVTLIEQKNGGPAKARNRGLQIAKGNYIAYLDADDFWKDTFLQKTISFLELHHECVAVSVGQKHLAIQGNLIKPSCLNDFKEAIAIKDFWTFWLRNAHICTGSAIIRTYMLKKIGGQREDLRITEDLELWALISTYGNWGFIPEVLFTSDGTSVIMNKSDWLNKMQRRWENAPSISEWEKRIIAVKPELHEDEGYKRARGRISRNLTYCQLLSDRLSLSREEAQKYGDYFTNDTIGRLMKIAKHSQFTWWILARFLKYREYHRK